RPLGRGLGGSGARRRALWRGGGSHVLRRVDVQPPERRVQGGARRVGRSVGTVGISSHRLPDVHRVPGVAGGTGGVEGGISPPCPRAGGGAACYLAMAARRRGYRGACV